MDWLEKCFNYFNEIPKFSLKLPKKSLFLIFKSSGLRHPESLPTFRLPLLLLFVGSLALDCWQETAVIYAIDETIVFMLCVLLPPSGASLGMLGFLTGVTVWFPAARDLLLDSWMTQSIAVALSILARRFLLRVEWQLASQNVLAALTRSGDTEGADTVIATTLTMLRKYANADAAIALRQLDDVTAEALACVPAKALPTQFTSPKIFAEALGSNRCIYYWDYPATPGANRTLLSTGAKSLAVLPLSAPAGDEVVRGPKPGAIVLVWYHRYRVSAYFQNFAVSVLGGLSTILRFHYTTFRLEKLQTRYSAILQTIPQGVVFVDASGEQGWINSVAAQQLSLTEGAQEATAIADAMAKLRSKAQNPQEIAAKAAAFFSKPDAKIRDWEWVFPEPECQVLNLSSTPTLVRDVPGRLWLLDDITDRYLNRLALVDRTAQLEAANNALQLTQFSVDRAGDAIFWIGSDAQILYVNDAACFSLGYSRSELLSMNVSKIDANFTLTVWPLHWETIRECDSITLESEHCTKHGKLFPVEVKVNYLEFNGSEYHCAFVRDISDRKQVEAAIRAEQEKSEKLLLNILPQSIAKRLKQRETNIAEGFANVTILFADIVGFTQLSSQISPKELVYLLNEIFSEFDRMTDLYHLEKIKTIGDAYMVAGGIPLPRSDGAEAVAEMAIGMQQAIGLFNITHGHSLSIRIGINTGAVVAGVIGTKKFIYDLWGDAVNTASRMESHGIPGCIHVTEATRKLLGDKYIFQDRGVISIKGKGKMRTYLLIHNN
ncbi:adenylate/guanylate cyclase domain-containing protein [Microcoleus sp. bin38.metabat.b11b12b14.051]|uniref:adenylate/guanylate cyclase domain-containing protein n=1 Tax=Microcoleus sp. bin38.metabat.b11b12b14.051 TaxID=2742709 RepID=UPI0026010EF9|nr:adenylate/guanylate cyclase domain-containing protein [Microcoleus sp. bin38.metabat.b11b12b14.051]